MLNDVTIQGRLCAAPELKTSTNGTQVVRIRLGVTRNYKNANGEYDSDFVSVIAWRAAAEFIAKHFGKGDMIIVRGCIKTGEYTNSDGVRKFTFDVEADSVYFAASKSGAKPNDSGYYPDEPPAPSTPPSAPKPAPGSAAAEAAEFANAATDDYPF